MNQAEIIRLSQTQARILALLREASPRGLSTWDLIDRTHHSAAARRVWELRQKGYQIVGVEGKKGQWTWFLRAAQQPCLPMDGHEATR